jgi:hypothetical protein
MCAILAHFAAMSTGNRSGTPGRSGRLLALVSSGDALPDYLHGALSLPNAVNVRLPESPPYDSGRDRATLPCRSRRATDEYGRQSGGGGFPTSEHLQRPGWTRKRPREGKSPGIIHSEVLKGLNLSFSAERPRAIGDDGGRRGRGGGFEGRRGGFIRKWRRKGGSV